MKKLTISFSIQGDTVSTIDVEPDVSVEKPSGSSDSARDESFSDSSSYSDLTRTENGSEFRSPNGNLANQSSSPSEPAESAKSTPVRRKSKKGQEINPDLLNRILNEGSKFARKRQRDDTSNDDKPVRKHPRLEQPCVIYSSKAQGNTLKFPPAIQLAKLLNVGTIPRVRSPSFCTSCGHIAKYKMPRSLVPYCSVLCLRNISMKDGGSKVIY